MSKALKNYLNKQKTIVNSAKTVFLEKGYTATSMDKVAKKACVTKQTVYRYFPSKTDLFRATMEFIADKDIKEHSFGNRDIPTELFEFGKIFLRFHMKKERLNLIRLMVAEGRKDKALSHTFFETRQTIGGFGVIAPFLEEQLPQLEDPQFSAKLFLDMLLGIRLPILLGSQELPSQSEISLHVKKVVDFFWAGCQFSISKTNK
ncbi:MAG: TetR/AcrR family transcriptional regulator [Desulfobacter sp.]|nr:TetR/AcrR family transcriptional regulator [Desulfobacter sp.]